MVTYEMALVVSLVMFLMGTFVGVLAGIVYSRRPVKSSVSNLTLDKTVSTFFVGELAELNCSLQKFGNGTEQRPAVFKRLKDSF